jgi:uncharacterized protein YegP (UPF0339 family)
VEPWKAEDGWRWRAVAQNGRIVATGQAHRDHTDAVRAIEDTRAVFRATDPEYVKLLDRVTELEARLDS